MVDRNAVFEGGDDSLSVAFPIMGSAVRVGQEINWFDVLAGRLPTELLVNYFTYLMSLLIAP